jgi:Spy/CpxP family protein refolding chaperone
MMRKRTAGFLFAFALALGQLSAQGPPPGGPPPHMGDGPGHPGPMDRTLHLGPPGRWWSDPRLAQLLQLTAAQQKAMDNVFDQNRAKLIELNNSLRNEESILRPLVASDTLDEAKILSQIDRVAQARAELEKANGRMLIELRKLLVGDQWRRLQANDRANRRDWPDHRP